MVPHCDDNDSVNINKVNKYGKSINIDHVYFLSKLYFSWENYYFKIIV